MRSVFILIISLFCMLSVQAEKLHSTTETNLAAKSSQQLPSARKSAYSKAGDKAVSSRPLKDWKSGFLTGNGNMGVIMQGEPYDEKLVVNGKIYLPMGSDEVMPDLSIYKVEFKKAGLAAGKDGPKIVHHLMVEKSGHKLIATDPFHPAFFLRITKQGNSAKIWNYRMTEDFTTGELEVRWSDDQGDWTRKVFASRADDVIVMSIKGPKGMVSCDLKMEMEHPLLKTEIAVADGWLSAHNTYLKGKGGYDNLIRVVPSGGTMVNKNDRLSVNGADSLLLIMQVISWKTPLPSEKSEAWAYSQENPCFKGDYTTNWLPEMKQTLSRLKPDYQTLFTPHIKLHRALYSRTTIDLDGGADRKQTSEELLERSVREGVMPKALAERLYNACRYLIICSTGDTPPNLQGIWNGTWSPDWSGDYTLDSNIQLEIQSMMSCNMPELMKSYFNLVDSWIPDMRLNAKKIFGFRGVVANPRASNCCLMLHWGDWPGDQAGIGLAGWMLHFYYDYYQFTGDREFLVKRFIPFAREIALFYEDFLANTEDSEGKYRFYMGYSPEHGLYANTTFDIAIAKNVLTTLISACKELNIEQENLPKWQTMLSKMPPYLINEFGELKEWSWPGVAEDYNQRHHSHFLPLYQFCEFDTYTTPELWKGTELAFDAKVKYWLRSNDKVANSSHITHGMMNEGQCAVRLGRSDVVYEVISRMATRNYIYPGFMISYWPELRGYGFDPVGTIPDIINNSLIFGWNNTVDLLPALPGEWPKGSIKGILLRGQVLVRQLRWDIKAGNVQLSIISLKDQAITLHLPDEVSIISAKTDKPTGFEKHEIGLNNRKIKLSKGKLVNVEFTFAPWLK